MKVIQQPKKRGEWVELQFLARAAAQGLTVSRPWGESAPYDAVVENSSKLYRVQVKSTTFRQCGAYKCITVLREKGGVIVPYKRSQIDFFAFYLIPEDLWYIIPVSKLFGKRAVCLNPEDRKSPYFCYLEAWHLLRGPVSSRPLKRPGQSVPTLRKPRRVAQPPSASIGGREPTADRRLPNSARDAPAGA